MAEAAALMAVSDGVADEVVRRLAVDRPTVVLNCPPAWHADEPLPAVRTPPCHDRRPARAADRPVPGRLQRRPRDRGARRGPGRAGRSGDFDVAAVFIGYGRLHDWLRERAEAARDGRIVVVDAIAPGELLEYTVDADVGYVGVARPNAERPAEPREQVLRVPPGGRTGLVAEGTAHCRAATELAVGRCVDIDRPATIAAAVAELLGTPEEERDRLRRHAREVGLTRYTWERQQDGLVRRYRRARRRRAMAAGRAHAGPRRSPSSPTATTTRSRG